MPNPPIFRILHSKLTSNLDSASKSIYPNSLRPYQRTYVFHLEVRDDYYFHRRDHIVRLHQSFASFDGSVFELLTS